LSLNLFTDVGLALMCFYSSFGVGFLIATTNLAFADDCFRIDCRILMSLGSLMLERLSVGYPGC
jgi:hypothetical protein